MSHDAHAWPEIYLSGLGWTHLFEPTPGQSGTTTGGSALPNDAVVATPTSVPPTTTPPTATSPTGGTGGTTPSGTTPVAPTRAPTTPTSSDDPFGPWLVVVVVLALLVLAVASYVGVVLTLKRRRRDRRSGAADPAEAVVGAWEEALDRLHEVAVVPRGRAHTRGSGVGGPRQHGQRDRAATPPAGACVQRGAVRRSRHECRRRPRRVDLAR